MPLPLNALKSRNYRLYFSGQLLSMVGTWMQSTVQAWLVYRLSGSATWLGIVSFSMQMPAFLTRPLAGVIVDRVDRRKLLLWTETVGMLQAFLLAALVYTGHIALWHIALLSILLGVVNAFELTTRHAFAADLVPRADLHNALAWNSVTINGSRIIGPALAGVLIAIVGETWCFMINGISFLAVILGLLFMRMNQRTIAKSLIGPLQQMRDGARYLTRHPEIRKLVLLTMFISFFGLPFSVLLPVFAKETLGGNATTLGWLIGSSGAGAILGAFRRNSHEVGTDMRQLLWIGLSLCLLGLSKSAPLSILATFAIGYFMMGLFPAINTTIQQKVEDSYRGRVLSLYTMSFLGAMPLGSLLSGWLSDRLGAPGVQTSFGAVFLLAGFGLKNGLTNRADK